MSEAQSRGGCLASELIGTSQEHEGRASSGKFVESDLHGRR